MAYSPPKACFSLEFSKNSLFLLETGSYPTACTTNVCRDFWPPCPLGFFLNQRNNQPYLFQRWQSLESHIFNGSEFYIQTSLT
jgi:hypothetical protein